MVAGSSVLMIAARVAPMRASPARNSVAGIAVATTAIEAAVRSRRPVRACNWPPAVPATVSVIPAVVVITAVATTAGTSRSSTRPVRMYVA